MRRQVWRNIRRTKRFYTTTFRFSQSALVFSLVINVVLGVVIWHTYLYQPKRHFYITNGMVPPTEVIPLDARNMSAVPLLGNDPDAVVDEKILNVE
ncbi:MAG: hypothetical protein GW760_01025 [Legionella sp.]|jgi:hypothetical protein|nr:hypothetical protein [Legionella sp.]